MRTPLRRGSVGGKAAIALVAAASVASSLSGLIQVAPAAAQICPAGTDPFLIQFDTNVIWEPTAANSRNGASQFFENVGGSGVDLTLRLTDPLGRNQDLDNTLATDPAFNPGLSGWDQAFPTQTTADGFDLEMNSLSDTDEVTWSFDWSVPVFLPDFAVADVDYTGYNGMLDSLGVPIEEPYASFQDEVRLFAERGGNPVAFNVSARGGARPVITGPASFAGGPYLSDTLGDLAPTDPNGIVDASTVGPITSVNVVYSNGPADAAAEANPANPAWPAPVPAGATGVSDSHFVRILDFNICRSNVSLGDTVFLDIDGDGVQDAGEQGVPNVRVVLMDPEGNTVEETVTDAEGMYIFERVPPFTWTVEIDTPAGYTNTGDRDPVPDGSTDVALGSTDVLDADFGIQPPLGTVAGTVFSDILDDGDLELDEGDTPIGGVTVQLQGTDGAGNTIDRTTLTLDDGTYEFIDVPQGVYTLTETQPAGFDDGIDTPGTFATAAGNDAFTVELPLGESSLQNDFAEVPTSSLAGTVVEDRDDDGIADPDEVPIPGVTLTLTGVDIAGNDVMRVATTNAAGDYRFAPLRPGIYDVIETQPDGYFDGQENPGSAGGSDAINDRITGVVLDADVDAIDYDFAELRASSIAGCVVDDLGTGIPGVILTLTGIDNTGAEVNQTTTTGPNGCYEFTNLRPGTYDIAETQPAGYGDGDESVGTAGGSNLSNDAFVGIVLGAGVDADDYDFAEILSSIAGTVVIDFNDNGVADPTDVGIAGVTLTLTGVDVNGVDVNATTTTDASGDYLFPRLLEGTYEVTETQPVEYFDGQEVAGSVGGEVVSNDVITAIPLPAGTAAIDYDFGELATVIAGTVWIDDNADGVRDESETTVLPGVTIEILDATGSVVDTAVTDENGVYITDMLPPGTYTVVQMQPEGVGSSTPDVIVVELVPAGTNGIDFGETLSGLTGRVWDDDSVTIGLGNSLDEDEPGVSGVTVTLTGPTLPVPRTTTTAPDGTYEFLDLLGGDYTVTITLPENENFVSPNMGDDAIDSDVDPNTGVAQATVPVGTIVPDVDAGLVQTPPPSPPGGGDPVVTPPDPPSLAVTGISGLIIFGLIGLGLLSNGGSLVLASNRRRSS